MDHIRIDEGIKRDYPQRANSNPRNPAGQFLPIASSDQIAKALTDYAAGATLDQIATTHGVSKQAVYSWLLGDLGGKEHADLVTYALTSRIADADQNLDESATPLDLSRAREQARFRRMDFERRRAHIYGQQQPQIAINTSGPVQVNIVSFYDTAPQQSESVALPAQVAGADETVKTGS